MNLSLQKKAPGKRKVASVGPETKNARPSAKKFQYWRPLAVVLLAVSAQVYNEDQSTIKSPGLLYNEKMQQDLSPEQITRLSGFFAIRDLNENLPTIYPSTPIIKPVKTPRPIEDNDRINALSIETQQVPDQVIQWLTTAGWPPELLDQAAKVVDCESKNNPSVIGDPNERGGPPYGLFQIKKEWYEYFEEDFEKWADPISNSKLAYKIYQYDIEHNQAPWTQWSCKP